MTFCFKMVSLSLLCAFCDRTPHPIVPRKLAKNSRQTETLQIQSDSNLSNEKLWTILYWYYVWSKCVEVSNKVRLLKWRGHSTDHRCNKKHISAHLCPRYSWDETKIVSQHWTAGWVVTSDIRVRFQSLAIFIGIFSTLNFVLQRWK